MRQLFQEQPSLIVPMVEHRHAEELAVIDQILRDHPAIIEWVLQDLQRGDRANMHNFPHTRRSRGIPKTGKWLTLRAKHPPSP